MGSRWPTVTGTWLLTPAAVYAVLAALELRELGYDPTAPEPGYLRVGDSAPRLVEAAAVGLPIVVLGGVASLVAGRAGRTTDVALAAGLGVGGVLLWSVGQVGPVAPVLLGAAGALLLLSALLPQPREAGPRGSLVARVLLATGALVAGWVLMEELAELAWQVRPSTFGHYAGLGVAVLMLLAAVVGPWLSGRAWRWVVGGPLALLGLALVFLGVLGLREGYLVSGYEENEHGWLLGGPPLFLGAGLTAAGLAALRHRWPLAAGTAGTSVLTVLVVLFAIPEVRSGF